MFFICMRFNLASDVDIKSFTRMIHIAKIKQLPLDEFKIELNMIYYDPLISCSTTCYKQIFRSTMDSPLSLIIADIVMLDVETLANYSSAKYSQSANYYSTYYSSIDT